MLNGFTWGTGQACICVVTRRGNVVGFAQALIDDPNADGESGDSNDELMQIRSLCLYRCQSRRIWASWTFGDLVRSGILDVRGYCSTV